MKKILLLSILASLLCIGVNAASGPLYINEVLFDPASTDTPNDYIEIRGAAGSTIPPNTYVLEIEGDSGTSLGEVQDSLDISGLTIGANGFLVLTQVGNIYVIDGGANSSATLDEVENASLTVILAQSPTAPVDGTTDLDADDNGEPDGAFFAALIINDSIGLLDGGASDRAYGEFNYLRNGSGSAPSGSATLIDTFDPGYAGRRGDTTGSASADWVVSDDPQIAPPLSQMTNLGGVADWFLPAAAGVFPDAVAGAALNHIGGPNANFAPTAAPGTIQGRAVRGNGRGVKHAVIMLTGGDLGETIYATTNQFGYYQFQDIGVGQTYVMQITSRRYTFQSPTRVINLDDSITDEDFIVDEPSGDTIPNGKKDGSITGKESKRRL